MTPENIYEYVKVEESKYDTEEVRVGNNWSWNMKQHIQMIFHLKNGVFFTGDNDWMRSFKNIMEPILNLSYWSEDIEVKDIEFYTENKNNRELSFLIKKYHDEVFVRENNVDTLIDEITEEDVDYGGVLVQKGVEMPEVIPMPTIAFCDQTDIMGGGIAFKFNFTPSKLRQMEKVGWGKEENGANVSIKDLVIQAEASKKPLGKNNQGENETSGKNIEVYIVRGDFPEHWMEDNENMEDYSSQVHIVGFYYSKDDKREGVTLFKKYEKDSSLKFHTSKKVPGRALGRGVGESLLHPQIWTNFLEIHKMAMLEAGSKVPLQTDDENFTNRNAIQDMDNLEVTVVADGKQIRQIPTVAPANVQLYDKSINEWFEQAQTVGSAFDPMLGKEPNSGTTFRGQERTVQQGRGLHDRRRGQRAKFIEELYRWDIIPRMKKELTSGKKFLATLTTDEMKYVSERMVDRAVRKRVLDLIFDGELVTQEVEDFIREEEQEKFAKGGNKRLIEVLKGELKDVEIKMGINIAGKQKNLALMTDKVLSIFQFAFSNPQGFQQIMQMPGMSSAFNDILEFSGVSPVDFATLTKAPTQPQGKPQQNNTESLQNLTPEPQNAQ